MGHDPLSPLLLNVGSSVADYNGLGGALRFQRRTDMRVLSSSVELHSEWYILRHYHSDDDGSV